MKKFFIPILFAILILTAGCSSEPPSTSASPAAPEDTAALLTLEVPGLSDGAELINETNEDDGTSRTEWLYDSSVTIVSARVQCIEADAQSLETQIMDLGGMDTSKFDASIDDNLSQKFSYPVWRIRYTTGSNEDTRTNEDIYIQTDRMDYWFHTSTPSDFYEDYRETIETWIISLVFSD